jgi:hypothetical protein
MYANKSSTRKQKWKMSPHVVKRKKIKCVDRKRTPSVAPAKMMKPRRLLADLFHPSLRICCYAKRKNPKTVRTQLKP